MIQSLQTLHCESPISRLIRYAATKAEQMEQQSRMARETVSVPKKTAKKAKKIKMNPQWVIYTAKRGTTITAIAAEMGRSRQYVWKILGRAGVDMRPLRKPFANQEEPTEEMATQARALFLSGLCDKAVARELNTSVRCVWESIGMTGGMK